MRKWLLLIAAAAAAQTVVFGPQVLTFLSDVDDSDQPYALYVPRDYTPEKKWPLVVSLHDAGSNHRLNLRRVFGLGNRPGESDPQATRTFPDFGDVEYLVVSPLARGAMGYQGIAEKDVYDVLASVKQRFRVDEDRVFLTGLSMGGGGSLWLGLTRPDVWAAIAPVCPALPSGLEELAGNALNVPVRLFQGNLDPVVPAVQTRAWHQRLLDAGVKAEYVEYKGVRHNAWDYAYKDRAIFEWFNNFERVTRPLRVQFSTDSYSHSTAWWLRLDKFTPGTLASAEAEFSGSKVTVKTKSLDGFTLDPNATPAKPMTVEIDGTAVRLRPGSPASFQRTPKGWISGLAQRQSGEKRFGAEGPVSAAISGPHLYIYGTEGSPALDELAARREAALRAADWSNPRARLSLNFRVLADAEARESDITGANLVLFGTRETNSRIAAIANQLPLHLNPGAADYGLVYVYPVAGRYVVIASGLPWWTRLDQANRPGLPFVAPAWRTLNSFGDYIVFRGGLDNVVAEGRFDNQWRLPPAVLQTLRNTGAVEIRENAPAAEPRHAGRGVPARRTPNRRLDRQLP